MATVIKAWKARLPDKPDNKLFVILVSQDGGDHYRLIIGENYRCETLTEADHQMTERMLAASDVYGTLVWDDDTEQASEAMERE